MLDWPQEGSGGGAAFAPPDGEVVAAEALLLGPVEIVVYGMAGLTPGLDERVEQWIVPARRQTVSSPERP